MQDTWGSTRWGNRRVEADSRTAQIFAFGARIEIAHQLYLADLLPNLYLSLPYAIEML
jgi:hypothetical protein